MSLYKVLNEDGKPFHGGVGEWPLPKDGKSGEWLAVTGDLIPCENGIHLCREANLVYWLGPTIYEAEHNGELIEHENKIVVRQARLIRQFDTWNERTARLFACDCAEHVLHIFEKQRPDDSRVRTAIEVARLYANRKATLDDLNAARAAARAAAGTAARAAAGTAARAAARAAAWDAAGTAARAAAGTAARDAAGDAETKWQTERLMEYLRGDVT